MSDAPPPLPPKRNPSPLKSRSEGLVATIETEIERGSIGGKLPGPRKKEGYQPVSTTSSTSAPFSVTSTVLNRSRSSSVTNTNNVPNDSIEN